MLRHGRMSFDRSASAIIRTCRAELWIAVHNEPAPREIVRLWHVRRFLAGRPPSPLRDAASWHILFHFDETMDDMLARGDLILFGA